MSSHNPQVFRELLVEFRDGYAKYGDNAVRYSYRHLWYACAPPPHHSTLICRMLFFPATGWREWL